MNYNPISVKSNQSQIKITDNLNAKNGTLSSKSLDSTKKSKQKSNNQVNEKQVSSKQSFSSPESTASNLAGNVSKYEDQLVQLMSANKPDEGQIEKTKILYQRAMRVLTLFSEMMKNGHEMMMSLIRNLRLS